MNISLPRSLKKRGLIQRTAYQQYRLGAVGLKVLHKAYQNKGGGLGWLREGV